MSVKVVLFKIALLLLASVLTALISTNKSQAEQLGFYVEAELHSPAVYLDDLVGDWKASSYGDYAYGYGALGSWFQINSDITFGVEKRVNQYLNFSSKTANFYGQLENDQLPVGDYPLSLSVNANSSQGIFIEYNVRGVDALDVKLTGHALMGRLVQVADLTGEGHVLEDGAYTYQYSLNYKYGVNRIFDRPSPGVTGYGHSFDLDVEYAFSPVFSVGASFSDLFYRMYWSAINRDKGCVARPSPVTELCVLRTDQLAFTQSLPEHITLYAIRNVRSFDLGVKGYWVDRHREYWLSIRKDDIFIALDLNNEVFDIGYESEWLAVKWAFDDYRYDHANSWQVSLDAKWAYK